MGFLGYLHVGITVDRLRQEYGSDVSISLIKLTRVDYRYRTNRAIQSYS